MVGGVWGNQSGHYFFGHIRQQINFDFFQPREEMEEYLVGKLGEGRRGNVR